MRDPTVLLPTTIAEKNGLSERHSVSDLAKMSHGRKDFGFRGLA